MGFGISVLGCICCMTIMFYKWMCLIVLPGKKS